MPPKPQKTLQSSWRPGRVVVRKAFERFPHGSGRAEEEQEFRGTFGATPPMHNLAGFNFERMRFYSEAACTRATWFPKQRRCTCCSPDFLDAYSTTGSSAPEKRKHSVYLTTRHVSGKARTPSAAKPISLHHRQLNMRTQHENINTHMNTLTQRLPFTDCRITVEALPAFP